MNDAGQFVVPDCGEPDHRHEPPGKRAAAYWYEYRDRWTGLSGYGLVLCVECCARIRMASQRPEPGIFAPPATCITPLRDANTRERVI